MPQALASIRRSGERRLKRIDQSRRHAYSQSLGPSLFFASLADGLPCYRRTGPVTKPRVTQELSFVVHASNRSHAVLTGPLTSPTARFVLLCSGPHEFQQLAHMFERIVIQYV